MFVATSFCLLETSNFTVCLLETSLLLMNEYPPTYEWMKISIYIQENIFHLWKRMQYWCKVQHRWTLRMLFQVKGTSHKDIFHSNKLFTVGNVFCCSVTKLCLTLCHPMDCSMWGFPSLSPRVCSNSCLLSRWCYPIIPSSVIFSFVSSVLTVLLIYNSYPIQFINRKHTVHHYWYFTDVCNHSHTQF